MPAGGSHTLSEIDLTDTQSFASGFPHDVFAFLRGAVPVWRHPPSGHAPDGFWVLTRYADCVAAAMDPRLHAAHRADRASLDDMDDDRYQGLRGLLGPALSPPAMRGIEDEVRWTAEQLVAAAVKRRHVDFVTDVAAPLAFHTMARVLGVPERDRRQLLSWVTSAAHDAILSYGEQLIGEKRRHPGADLLSKTIHAHIDNADPEHDHLDQREVLVLFDLLVTAGIDTTRDAIAVGVLALAEHPEEWWALQADRSKLRRATEEILRWTSPTPCDERLALSDVDFRGTRIQAGERVTLWWASANRDDAAFTDPDRFDVGRDPNPHMAFGHGGHSCFGATLARLQIRLLLDVLVDHVSQVTVADDPRWACSREQCGLGRLPLELELLR